uniref:Kinesin-like protein n=1 Tax=Rhabditophanes sp. KR3021 TaxID=114890 RepID=A0AC35TXD7_9BILA
MSSISTNDIIKRTNESNLDNVLTVAVRVRADSDKENKQLPAAYAVSKSEVLLVDPEKFRANILRQNRQFEKQFKFDAVFGVDSKNAQIHTSITEPLINLVVAGNNATIFAYGATGAGKTYTMVGTKENPGLMPLMTESLYEKIKNTNLTELYNELIRDLLNPTSPILDLLEDDKGNVNVPRLSKVKAINKERVLQILQGGNSRRTKESTAANKESSRSHAILEVSVFDNSNLHGRLFLIDLAGSERASQTKNQGLRLKEGAAINKSLLALGNVINSLSSNNKGRYVNYRDSKLTRLLKDSLGGNSKTCMIANITSGPNYYEETYNTLLYASRALNISTNFSGGKLSAEEQNSLNTNIEIARREYFERNNLSGTKNYPRDKTKKNSTPTLTPTSLPKKDPRGYKSMFSSLKEQYLSLITKQNKLRESLLTANREAYDIDINHSSKQEILSEWTANNSKEAGQFPRIIQKFRLNIKELEEKSVQIQELRLKVEKNLNKNDESMKAIEDRLKSLAKDTEQQDVITFMVGLGHKDGEKYAIRSDSALLLMRMKRQDFSLKRVYNYENVVKKLIEDNLSDNEREQLNQEYILLKSQLKYNLLTLKHEESMVSWNTQFLSKLDTTKHLPKLDIEQLSKSKTKSENNGNAFPKLTNELPALFNAVDEAGDTNRSSSAFTDDNTSQTGKKSKPPRVNASKISLPVI